MKKRKTDKRFEILIWALVVVSALLGVVSYGGPIKGLVDIGTGQEVPDADARYTLAGGTNSVGWFTNLYVEVNASNGTQVVNWRTMTNWVSSLSAYLNRDGDGDGLELLQELGWDGDFTEYNPFDSVDNPSGTDLNDSKTDTDGDTVSDSEEIAAGSNPLDSNSVSSVTIKSITTPGGKPLIKWDTYTNQGGVSIKFYVDYRPDLFTPFTNLTNGVLISTPGSSGEVGITDYEHAPGGLYRLRYEPMSFFALASSVQDATSGAAGTIDASNYRLAGGPWQVTIDATAGSEIVNWRTMTNYVAGNVETLKTTTSDYLWTTGRVWFVAKGSDLQAAHDAASDGDTLLLASGTNTITAEVNITKSICIRGQGRGKTVVQFTSNGTYGVFDVMANDVELADMTIISDQSDFGILIIGGATPLSGITLRNLIVSLPSATGGRFGVHAVDASLTIIDCDISAESSDDFARGISSFTGDATTPVTYRYWNVRAYSKGMNNAILSPDSVGFFVGEGGLSTVSAELQNCFGIAEEGESAATTYGLYSSGADMTLVVQDTILNGADADIRQADSASVQVRSVVLVNNTTSGTITRQGTLWVSSVELDFGTVTNNANAGTEIVNWRTMTNHLASGINYHCRPAGSNLYDWGSALYPWRTGYFHTVSVDTNSLLIGGTPLGRDATGDLIWNSQPMASQGWSDTNLVKKSGDVMQGNFGLGSNQLYSVGNVLVSSANVTIDWDDGNIHEITLTTNVTFAFSNVRPGTTYMLKLKQDGTGSRTVTWPASIKWFEDTPPTLSTATGRWDIASFAVFSSTNEISGRLGSYWGP